MIENHTHADLWWRNTLTRMANFWLTTCSLVTKSIPIKTDDELEAKIECCQNGKLPEFYSVHTIALKMIPPKIIYDLVKTNLFQNQGKPTLLLKLLFDNFR